MQEVFEKIKKKLATELIYYSGYPDCSEYDYAYEIAMQDANNKARKIVNEVAEEYNNGWIPVEEDIPPKDVIMHCFVEMKHIDSASSFRTMIDWHEGYWTWSNGKKLSDKYEVLAWQKIQYPEPYQPKGD